MRKDTLFSKRGIALLLVMLLGVAPALPVQAATDATPLDTATIEKNRKANAECYTCHSAAAIKKPPRADLDLGKLKDSRIEPEVFNPSDHGVMDCRECHASNYGQFPHSPTGKNETRACTDCHAAKVLRLEPQFDASVHAKSEGVKEKFTCSTCHDAHVNIVQKRLKDPLKIVAQDNHGCLECHNSEITFAKFAPDNEKTPGIKKKRPDIDTLHEWLPNAKLHWASVRCIDCHTPEVAANKMLSHEILNKEKAEKKCVACHSANSSLKTRLYRHLVKEEQQKHGFTNSVFLSSSYVIGATRHPVLDSLLVGMVGATLLGVLIHGAIRIVIALRRRKEKPQ
ncbi:cytochrome c3 family protein [Rhodoferax sp.]|uniref:cytochrome c3 family protein n=1 Tax=Rhodoferax sp. TaxID=50421 RepID=UPI00276468AA|nr:cytochrome c3 family protein [Rhodoferax sp.]